MKKNKVIIGAALAGLTIGGTVNMPVANAACTDMVDNSNNHSGVMTVENYTAMRNQYGVKAIGNDN